MLGTLFKRRHCLGVDLGATAIRTAVYRGRELLTATVPAPPGGLNDPQAMVAALAEAASRTGWHGRQAVTAITGERVVVRYLRLPQMAPAELKAGMAYELENYLPTGTRDMVVDWTILDDGSDRNSNQMHVLLAAAPREQVTQLYNLFQNAGLELRAIDLVPLALCRALAATISGAVTLLDVGDRWSHLVLTRAGQPLFSRVIAMGAGELARPGIAGTSRLAELTQEVRRSLEFYRSQSGGEFNSERLVLTGEGVGVEGLLDFCQEELGVPVTPGRPGLGGGEAEPALAVAIGLALREIKA